jgi:hypothetical protein
MSAGGRVAGVLVAAAVVTPGASPLQAPNRSANAIVATAATYVGTYQRQFAFLLADEISLQRVVSRRAGSAGDETATRQTRGELFITYLGARRHWTAVRDVAEIDGVAVADREDLARLIESADLDDVARRLFALNARYNLGSVVRNFNDPMLALLPLNDAHRARFRFSVGSPGDNEPGVGLVTVRFRERDRPTLVRGLGGGPAYAEGDITVEPATGVVRRTRIAVSYDDIDAELVTDFRHEARLGLWVPSTLVERYVTDRGGRQETTTVESSYTNYRRFEVRSRLKLPGGDR